MSTHQSVTADSPVPFLPAAAFAVYLAGLLIFFGSHLDLFLDSKGIFLSARLTLLFAMVAAPFLGCLLIGFGADRRINHIVAAFCTASMPLFFFFLWLTGHLIFLSSVNLQHGGGIFTDYLPFFNIFALVFGLTLTSAASFRQALRFAGTCAVFTLAGSIIYDAFVPSTFSVTPNRAAGFAMNANVAALDLNLLLAVSLRYKGMSILNLMLFLVGLTAIFLTFSRGGLISAGLLLVCYLFFTWRAQNHRSARTMIWLILALVAVGFTLSYLAQYSAVFGIANSVSRIDVFGIGGGSTDPDISRLQSFWYFAERVAERPILGYGTGSLDEPTPGPHGLGPHNMYLAIWYELGLWGILSYIGLLSSATWLFWQYRLPEGFILMCLIWLNGMFSHNILDDKCFLLLFGMVLGMVVRHGVPPERGLLLKSPSNHYRSRHLIGRERVRVRL